MTNNRINITLLDPNPWQTRAIDDDHMRALAADIRVNGLLQPPVARPHPKASGRYQLALGHHRLAAFAWLDSKDPKVWSSMQVEIRDLTDLEMAEIAIAENQKRKDLTPIEKAQALRRLIDEFKLSQEDAGKRFGLTQSAVSQLLRLLKLPASIQALTGDAGLPERHARQLVTLSKSLPAQAEAVAKKVAAAAPEEKDQALDGAMHDVLTQHGRQMYNPPFRTDEQLPIERVAKAAGKLGLDSLPLCKGCEFFLERGHINYCARPGCFDVKREAARWAAVTKAAKTLRISAAGPGEETKVIYNGSLAQLDFATAALKTKHASLRLVAITGDYQSWHPDAHARKGLLNSDVALLATTDLAALKKAVPESAVRTTKVEVSKRAEAGEAERDRRWKAEQAARESRRKEERRLEDLAARAIAPLLPNNIELLKLIGYRFGGHAPKGKSLQDHRLVAAGNLIELYLEDQADDDIQDSIEESEQPKFDTPEFTRVGLVLLAQKLKVKLPAEFSPNGHAAPNGKKATKESGVSTGKLSKRAKAQAAKAQPKKKGGRK